jgi:hypothetical protein
MITQTEVVHAFRHRDGPKRGGNCIYRGGELSYDCSEGTLYSFSLPIAKWIDEEVVALDLFGRGTMRTRQHLGKLGWVQCWAEPIEIGSGYNRWQFPPPEFFHSVLRPGEHELAKVRFWKKLREIPNGVYDENGREYSAFTTYYTHNSWVVKPYGKRWGLWSGESTQHCVLPRLSDTRTAIAKWESIFNDGYWNVQTWLSQNRHHSHWEKVETAKTKWCGEYFIP